MNGQLRERPARRLVLVPAPGLGGQLQRPLVGEIGLDEGDAAELARVDRLLDAPDSGHQACAVADRHGHAKSLFQRLDLQPFLDRAGDRLLRVDVLAGLRHLARDREMLLVRDRDDHARDPGIGEHGREIGRSRHPEFILECRALLLRAAITRGDREEIGLARGAREYLGPAAETDDSDFHPIRGHCFLGPRVATANDCSTGSHYSVPATAARRQPVPAGPHSFDLRRRGGPSPGTDPRVDAHASCAPVEGDFHTLSRSGSTALRVDISDRP